MDPTNQDIDALLALFNPGEIEQAIRAGGRKKGETGLRVNSINTHGKSHEMRWSKYSTKRFGRDTRLQAKSKGR